MLVLITGVQAAGKSTVAQALAERFPRSVHVRGDAFRRVVVNGAEEISGPLPSPEALRQLHLRYDLAVDVADRYAEAGFTTILQDVVLGPDLARVVDRIRSRPRNVVVLAPDARTVAARDEHRRSARGKVAYRADGPTVADLDRWLREDTPRIGHWLDTSDLDVAATVRAVIGSLGREALVE